jgi:hypothetical protein
LRCFASSAACSAFAREARALSSSVFASTSRPRQSIEKGAN